MMTMTLGFSAAREAERERRSAREKGRNRDGDFIV
jgi:hypothetical protein